MSCCVQMRAILGWELPGHRFFTWWCALVHTLVMPSAANISQLPSQKQRLEADEASHLMHFQVSNTKDWLPAAPQSGHIACTKSQPLPESRSLVLDVDWHALRCGGMCLGEALFLCAYLGAIASWLEYDMRGTYAEVNAGAAAIGQQLLSSSRV